MSERKWKRDEFEKAFGFDLRYCAGSQCGQVNRALDYAYTQGQKELAGEVWEWARNPYTTLGRPTLESWLHEKGLL